MFEENRSIELVPRVTQKLNKTSQSLAVRRTRETQADWVPHLGIEEVRRLADTCKERNRLLIQLMFDGCLRVGEAIKVRPMDIIRLPDGWVVSILGKGRKPGQAAISASLAAQLQAYAYRHRSPPDTSLFPVSSSRVFQIVTEAFKKAGMPVPSKAHDRVGAVHILRHSGAIERLRQTGNPKAVQDQLRHKSAQMTLRYLKTLSQEESLKIQQQVDYGW